MSRKGHYKLIRDRIPEIIAADGAKAKVSTLYTKRYRQELFKKLVEESTELGKSTDTQSILDEVADLQELIDAIATEFGLTVEMMNQAKTKKRQSRGGFEKRLFLHYVDE